MNKAYGTIQGRKKYRWPPTLMGCPENTPAGYTTESLLEEGGGVRETPQRIGHNKGTCGVLLYKQGTRTREMG